MTDDANPHGAAMPLAILAASAPPRAKPSSYPAPFFSRIANREKRPA